MDKDKAISKSLSPGQKKLASLGLSLPALPTTTVGSFPKADELKEFRFKVQQGVLQISELERKERIAIDIWLREQSRLKLDVFVDGEMNRGDFLWHFAKQIDGFAPGGLVRIYGNRFAKKPVIKTKLAWKGPVTAGTWQVVQRATHSTLKAVVTGPVTLADWSFNEFYSSRENLLEDLTSIIRSELVELIKVGCKIIQIDEPALSTHVDDFSLVSDCYKKLTKDLKCYFIVHHCFADLTVLWPKLIKLPVDNFCIESANSNFKILKTIRAHPTNKDVTLGVIDSHNPAVEDQKQISGAIHAALKHIPRRQLWIAPDCGLKTLPTETAIEKLDAMVKATTKIRAG